MAAVLDAMLNENKNVYTSKNSNKSEFSQSLLNLEINLLKNIIAKKILRY